MKGSAMFGMKKKFAVQTQTKIVKTPKDATPGEDNVLSPELVKLIAERSKDAAKCIAITAVAAYAIVKTIDTASQVIVKKTKSADNE